MGSWTEPQIEAAALAWHTVMHPYVPWWRFDEELRGERLKAMHTALEAVPLSPSQRLAAWLDEDESRAVLSMEDATDGGGGGWYVVLWDPERGQVTGHGDTRDLAIVAALHQIGADA